MDGPTLTCHDDGQLFFPCAALIILELDVSSWLHVMRTSQINFEVVDAIQKHNAIFQDHFHVLTKGAHAMIMAVKHIIVQNLYRCHHISIQLPKSRHQRNTAITSLHLIVLTHTVFKANSDPHGGLRVQS